MKLNLNKHHRSKDVTLSSSAFKKFSFGRRGIGNFSKKDLKDLTQTPDRQCDTYLDDNEGDVIREILENNFRIKDVRDYIRKDLS